MKRRKLTVAFFGILMVTGFLFSVPFGISIQTPQAGDIWCKGNTYKIQWSKAGTMHEKVKIRLYNPTGTVKILDITNDTDNNGSYSWNIPASLPGGHYKIRVKTLDGGAFADSGGMKIADCSSSILTVTQPFSSSSWTKGKSYDIKWSKSGLMYNKVKIRLYNKTGSTKIYGITSYAENSGVFPWTIPAHISPGDYRIRVKTLDELKSDDSEIFTITPVKVLNPLKFEVYEPKKDSYHLVGQVLPIKWRYKKVFKLPRTKSSKKYVGNDPTPSHIPTVKIEIKSVKCPPPTETAAVAEELAYKKYNFSKLQIKKFLKIPFKMGVLNWKTIAEKTPDDGAHYWKITDNFKKGCYMVRVTKRAALKSGSGPRGFNKAISKVFHIITNQVVDIQTELEELR